MGSRVQEIIFEYRLWIQLKPNNLNLVRPVAWLLYAIFEILLQVLFLICFVTGKKIIFWLELI